LRKQNVELKTELKEKKETVKSMKKENYYKKLQRREKKISIQELQNKKLENAKLKKHKDNLNEKRAETTGTCFIQKIYTPSSSVLQGKHLPFTPSPLRLNIVRLFVILSLTQLYLYTPEIFVFSTATFKYKYWAPLRRIGQNIQRKSHFLFFSH
jgi:hypothetical protein